MKHARNVSWLAVAAAVLLGASRLESAEPQPAIRVLILSGQNNHDWKKTTPVLAKILTGSGRFTVEVTEHPEQCTAETFARCDLVLSNWNALGPKKEWPEATRRALLDFVRGGGAFVVVHAGGTMFIDWTDFQKLIGATWGPGTGHGSKHLFEVKIVDPDHPITKGLPAFHITDELWHRMAAQPEKKVLATAFSAKEKGGSGQDEPMVMVTEFGKGHCFNLVLGHDVSAMENAGFRLLLLRGAEWAATGRVTITSAETPVDIDALLKSLAAYKFGDSREDMVAMQKVVGAASRDPAASKALAARFVALLDGRATTECKQFLCWQLSLVGGAAETPALAKCLGDADLAVPARFALERIPGEESLATLREALKASQGKLKTGLIDSLGARRDQQAIALIAPAMADSDMETAAAAIGALGLIGGNQAIDALLAAEAHAAAPLRPRLSDALLRCAEDLCKAGQVDRAAAIFEKLTGGERPRAVRIAAVIGRFAAQGEKGSGAVLATLASQDPILQEAAVRALREHATPTVLAGLVPAFNTLAPQAQAQLLALFGEYKCLHAVPAVSLALSSDDPAVKQAAIVAAGSLGNSCVALRLIAMIEQSSDEQQALIRDSVARIPSKNTNKVLIDSLAGAKPPVQCELIRALSARGATNAVPLLLTAARNDDAKVRREAIVALGKLADAAAGPQVLALLENAGDSGAIQAAVVAIFGRAKDSSPVVAAMEKATGERKVTLVAILGALRDEKALAAIRTLLKVDDVEVRMAAVRALAQWPDAAPLDDLMALAAASDSPTCKVLALRGVARMAPLATDRPAEKVADLVIRAMGLATRPDEMKGLLGALASVPCAAGLKTAVAHVKDPAVKNEATMAALTILQKIDARQQAEAVDAIEQLKAVAGDIAVFARSEKIPAGINLALGAKATNLDGLKSDGQGGPSQAAIDGDLGTYWDEVDNQSLYWIRVTLKQPATVTGLRITGFNHHSFAPRDFEIICDNKVVKKVMGAIYDQNQFGVKLPPTRCATMELKITGAYGPSPAIRELEIIGNTK